MSRAAAFAQAIGMSRCSLADARLAAVGLPWVIVTIAAGCGAGRAPAAPAAPAAPIEAPAAPATPEAPTAVERARSMLEAAKISQRWEVNERAAREGGLTEDAVAAAVEELAADCLAIDGECPQLDLGAAGVSQELIDVLETLAALLGEIGAERSVALLARLDARGFYQAGMARERLMTRRMLAAVAAYPCPPPTAEEVAAERARLEGFVAIGVRPDGALAPRPATARELDDLAYLLAATTGSGAEVGRATEEGEASWLTPGPENVTREELLARLGAGQRAGDAKAAAGAARDYLETLGYPGAITLSKADEFAWGGARLNYVMRDMADALETLGELDEAAHLYRRANPGGGACGSSVSSVWQSQVRGVVRCEERRRRCRAAVPERLLGLEFWPGPGDEYGTARLAEAGFDVARLFRGALVTINRDADPALLEAALAPAKAPAGRRGGPGLGPSQKRLRERGPEDWERRVYALEGYADVAGREAFPALLDAAGAAIPSVRLRAIEALGRVAAMPLYDPCDPSRFGGGSSSSEWQREITPLGATCETMLRPEESEALAAKLLPLARDPDPRLREAVARAVGEIGAPGSVPALQALLDDPFQDEGVRICNGSGDELENCRVPYIVREAAQEALDHIAELRANREAQR